MEIKNGGAPSDAPLLLQFLEKLVNQTLEQRTRQGTPKVGIERVVLRSGGGSVDLAVRGVARLVDGVYPVDFLVESTGAEKTVLRLDWERSGGIGLWVGRGLKIFPELFINERVKRLLGPGIAFSNDRIVINHQTLIKTLKEREWPSQRNRK